MADRRKRGRAPKTREFKGRTWKLTDEQVRQIRRDERAPCEIAHAFGISESHAWAIKMRRRKAHVPDLSPLEECEKDFEV